MLRCHWEHFLATVQSHTIMRMEGESKSWKGIEDMQPDQLSSMFLVDDLCILFVTGESDLPDLYQMPWAGVSAISLNFWGALASHTLTPLAWCLATRTVLCAGRGGGGGGHGHPLKEGGGGGSRIGLPCQALCFV